MQTGCDIDSSLSQTKGNLIGISYCSFECVDDRLPGTRDPADNVPERAEGIVRNGAAQGGVLSALGYRTSTVQYKYQTVRACMHGSYRL